METVVWIIAAVFLGFIAIWMLIWGVVALTVIIKAALFTKKVFKEPTPSLPMWTYSSTETTTTRRPVARDLGATTARMSKTSRPSGTPYSSSSSYTPSHDYGSSYASSYYSDSSSSSSSCDSGSSGGGGGCD